MPAPALPSLPAHILEDIAARVATDGVCGPPTRLVNVLLVCKALKAALAIDHLRARIFRDLFDTAAAARRFGPGALLVPVLDRELVSRCQALTRLRHGRLPPPHLAPAHDLWLVYLMLLEDDGKNMAHVLHYANVRTGILRRVEAFMDQSPAAPPTHWPAESVPNALMAWILALTDSEEAILEDSHNCRQAVQRLYLVFVYVVFMYPSAFAQWNVFDLPLSPGSDMALDIATVMSTPHPVSTPRAQFAPASATPAYYGVQRALAVPPLAHAAIALLFARINYPTKERPDWMTDAAWVAQQKTWEYGHTRYFGGPEGTDSVMRDTEWRRLVSCTDLYSGPVPGLEPMLDPGDLQGRWDGFYRMPDLLLYDQLIQANPAPPPDWMLRPSVEDPPSFFGAAVQWRLREYHCLAGNVPLSGSTDDAVDAWFPAGWWKHRTPEGTLRIWDPVRAEFTEYVPHAPGRARGEVRDTIVLGEPDDEWKEHFGEFEVYGRVRAADGLVVLRRDCVPHDAGRGRWLWYGYVHAGLNWIGRFRMTNQPIGLIAISGSFMVARSAL
ncbi:hypothetical protein AURDEDRAFT_114837 [Auricularia subglabra TFB-10046 SS5]|nr:hypothetical protein AURDEDRAFT_114837 [Auricularia subglabra TFB-10046 SS5]